VRISKVETLLISGELDTSTPPQVAAKELLPFLPNGHQVVLSGLGHTGSFFAEQPAAGSRLINTFFDSGRVDDSLYVPATIDFSPGLTLPALAKILLGVMLGLALLSVLSLLWMARSIYRHGRFGGKVSGLLRTALPLVFGLGGWCLGAVVVMTTLPTIPVNDPVLAVLSIGVPIWLGICLAWVNRDWNAQRKISGVVATAGATLLGAWLGFQASDGFLALITAIIGAAVSANLVLLTIDIGWDASRRSRFEAHSHQQAQPAAHGSC